MSNKKKVEAVLFSLGKEVSLDKLSELCSLEKEEVKKTMDELKEEYTQRDHSLSIIQRGEIYKLTVKDEFIPLVSKLVEGMDLDRALTETLAVIAWKYPVTQSDVIKLRHNKAYEHIKRLLELDFVEKEKFGRTFRLKLTKKFFEYFDLPSDEAKQAFLKQVPDKVLREAEKVDKEADEVGALVEQEKKDKKTKEEIKKALGKVKVEGKDEEAKKKDVSKKPVEEEEVEVDEEDLKALEKAEGDGDDDDDDEDGGDEEEESGKDDTQEKIEKGISWVFK